MKILAIDPGPEDSAYVLYNTTERALVEFGKIPNSEMLNKIWLKSAAGFDEMPDVCVIERIACYGMAVGREVFMTAEWTGRFDEAYWCMSEGMLPARIIRRDVKMHLCGNNTAKDANIRQALIDKFGPGKDKAIGKKAAPGPLYGVSNDVWAALAVAVTFAETRKKAA